MKLTLSEEAMASLPEPASDGVIRVTAGLKLSPNGEVTLVELNDMPMDGGSDEIEPDGDEAGAPDLSAMADELYGR